MTCIKMRATIYTELPGLKSEDSATQGIVIICDRSFVR